MKRKTVYLILCVLGAVVPYAKFAPWLLHNGLNLRLFFREMTVNDIAAFFALDVVMSAVVVIVFLRLETGRLKIRNRWLVPVALVTVGVSLGLPLFLYLRERAIEEPAG
jgi:Terpene cyclase DEP1